MTSRHYTTDRQTRENLISNVIGIGVEVATFVVDKGHPNGPERHVITDTGIIIVYNNRTNKLVTKLIARPNQIKRYYKNDNAPTELVELAYQHMRLGYNKM